MAKVGAHKIKERIAFLERNYVKGGLATEAEIAEVAARFKGKRSLFDMFDHWANLHAMGLARMPARDAKRRQSNLTPSELEAAREAMRERVEVVELHSVSEVVVIRPASYARIMEIEDHAFWMRILKASHALLKADHEVGNPHPGSPKDPCKECGRPQQPGQLHELLGRIKVQIEEQRAWLFTQILAPGPEPADKRVAWGWSKKITAVEEELLKQAYHRCNYEMLARLPKIEARDGAIEMPRDWAFFFAAMASDEHKAPKEVMSDRSLASTIAEYVSNHISREVFRKKAELEQRAKTGGKGGSKKKSVPQRRGRARRARSR